MPESSVFRQAFHRPQPHLVKHCRLLRLVPAATGKAKKPTLEARNATNCAPCPTYAISPHQQVTWSDLSNSSGFKRGIEVSAANE